MKSLNDLNVKIYADGADLKRAERISYSISEPNNG